MSPPIKVKVFAVLPGPALTHHLVWRGTDSTTEPDHFHRLLGGHLDFGEATVDAAVREIHEETGTTLQDPRMLGVLENRFVLEDTPGHEICFVYAGRLADPAVVGDEGGYLTDNGNPIPVEWRPFDDADVVAPLYPEGLRDLLAGVLA